MKLSERIRLARRRAELSQAALAARIGVRRSAVSNWEATDAAKPSTSNLIAIADATGVAMEWLATGRGRSATMPAAEADEVSAVDADLVDDPGERRLLADYRSLTQRAQLLVTDLLGELAKGRRK